MIICTNPDPSINKQNNSNVLWLLNDIFENCLYIYSTKYAKNLIFCYLKTHCQKKQDPDAYQNDTDPEHWSKVMVLTMLLTLVLSRSSTVCQSEGCGAGVNTAPGRHFNSGSGLRLRNTGRKLGSW
jgi:hypothetical protein